VFAQRRGRRRRGGQTHEIPFGALLRREGEEDSSQMNKRGKVFQISSSSSPRRRTSIRSSSSTRNKGDNEALFQSRARGGVQPGQPAHGLRQGRPLPTHIHRRTNPLAEEKMRLSREWRRAKRPNDRDQALPDPRLRKARQFPAQMHFFWRVRMGLAQGALRERHLFRGEPPPHLSRRQCATQEGGRASA